MAVRIFKITDYNHIAESKQFDSIKKLLEIHYSSSSNDCILIGNYNIEGVEIDALLITSGGFRILEFKNWGGDIVARENGSWNSNGLIVEGGAGGKSPYEQIRLNKSRVSEGLKKILGIPYHHISAAIIFLQDSNIDTEQLSDSVKSWLTVCDNKHVTEILKGMKSNNYSHDFLCEIPSKLRIEDFTLKENKYEKNIQYENYQPEASASFYEDLYSALTFIPNYRVVYKIYNNVFHRILNDRTDSLRLNFSGTFAKTDYLLQEYSANRFIVKNTNDTRVRLRNINKISDDELKDKCLIDLRNISEFISFIYKTQIPENLKSRFPQKREIKFVPTLIQECIRVIVDCWDDEFVFCRTDDLIEGDLLKINYIKNKNYPYDWSYLKRYFYKDAQLNLIRPRKENDVIYPELIIFEPDYLIDISSIARCFTNYADSPYINLINKLKESRSTRPLLLGNFSGQLLDETIHQLPDNHSYKQSALDFFRNNAMDLMAVEKCEEVLDEGRRINEKKDFHSEAKKQKQNICNAINVSLPEEVKRFNPKDGIVEPSFFSEMLGVQGRMDFLQLDFKVLLEQKSGKGEFPYDNFNIPWPKEEHKVQILLYRTLINYNFKEIYERNGKELQPFLLYSKYKRSLTRVSSAPELLFKAIKIRNGIVWTEMMYSLPNGYRILEEMTPESFCVKKNIMNDNRLRLWNTYQRPQIAKILEPLKNASELEKAYYFRFLRFISNEHIMSKLGSKTKESSGFASVWQDSLEDKKAAGNIYDQLKLVYPTSDTKGRIKSVTLKFAADMENDMSNFRKGDIIILYPYENNKEPDARKTIVFRCTIEDIQNDKIILQLRFQQSDNRVFVKETGKMWAIEHDFMESSYSSLYRGMHAFLSAPKSRRDLLLFQRKPEIDDSVSLKGDYEGFNELMLKVKRAKDLFLIIGPPGTGKTSFGLLNIVKEELLEHKTNILLLSYTNRAVDEICSKLMANRIDFIRIGGELNCEEDYKDKLLKSKVNKCENIEEIKSIIQNVRVFVGTITSLNSNPSLFKIKQFSLTVIDEASQILEPHLIGIMSANNDGVPAIKKFVLIGDHKQLPAVVQQNPEVSMVQEPLLQDILLNDCRFSLFERFLKKYGKDKKVTNMLKRQGRMHHDIALFPNYTFYGNQLTEVPCDHQNIQLQFKGEGNNGIDDLLQTRRVVFLASQSPDVSFSDKVNQIEADMIAATVVRIYELNKGVFNEKETVGVIVPYRNQIATVRNTLDRYSIKELHNITIDTVERYQGSERKYIIYGFTVQKYYQLRFLTGNVFEDMDGTIVDRKLNVAMTRAREHLIMIGNPDILSNNFTFFKLIEFIKSKHGYFEIEKDDYVKGNFTIPKYDPNDLDLSKAVFTTTQQFDDVFNKFVVQPIKDESGKEWPNKVFGYDMLTNLNTIGYGMVNFSNQLLMFDDVNMSPERQVLIYCYYIMRQHYCSSKNIFTSYKQWISNYISAVNGRVQFIDIGCGPATCGISFTELFKSSATNMVYTGIDISSAMKKMGRNLLKSLHGDDINIQMKESFNELDSVFWDSCSELPSLVFINISYFFSNVTPLFAENLSNNIVNVIKKYPLNKYVILIQHSERDSKLASYKGFRRVLKQIDQILTTFKQEKSFFSYKLNGNERNLEFCYEIQEN